MSMVGWTDKRFLTYVQPREHSPPHALASFPKGALFAYLIRPMTTNRSVVADVPVLAVTE